MNIFQFKSRIWVHHSFTIDQATTLSFKLVPNGLISLKYSQFTDALAAVKKHYEENKTWSYKLSNQLTLLSAKKLKSSSMREKKWKTNLKYDINGSREQNQYSPLHLDGLLMRNTKPKLELKSWLTVFEDGVLN